MRKSGGAAVLLAQLGMAVGVSWWGLLAFQGAMSWVAGIGLPVILLVVWHVFLSDNATMPVPAPVQFVVRLLLLLTGAAAFWAIGVREIAIAQAILAVLTTVFAMWGPSRESSEPAPGAKKRGR